MNAEEFVDFSTWALVNVSHRTLTTAFFKSALSKRDPKPKALNVFLVERRVFPGKPYLHQYFIQRMVHQKFKETLTPLKIIFR